MGCAPVNLCFILDLNVTLDTTGLTTSLVTQVRDSLAINNPNPTSGGKGAESVGEVKQNTSQMVKTLVEIDIDEMLKEACLCPSHNTGTN